LFAFVEITTVTTATPHIFNW